MNMSHRSFRSFSPSHASRPDEFENHVGERVGRFLGNKASTAWQADEASSWNRVGESIAELRAGEAILIAPDDEGWTINLSKFDLCHVLIVDRASQPEKMIESVLADVRCD